MIRIKKYLRIIKDEEIARRYFVMNSLDGALTILGVVIGMFFSGVDEPKVVMIASIGAAVAMAVSGIWGAYAAERAERLNSLRDLEKHMLRSLGGTRIGRSVQIMSILVALVNGLSPLFVSILLVLPFFASQLGIVSMKIAYVVALSLIFVVLFLTGLLVGKIGQENMLKSGVKMATAGIVVGIVVFLLEMVWKV